MSFFDSLFSSISPGVGSIISAGLGLAGNLAASSAAADGNEKAATIAGQSTAAQLEELKRAKAAGLGYLDTGAANYAGTVAPLLNERPVLQPTYRGLTTQQQLGRSDLVRTGQASLASSGLRGAGRAGIGSLLDSVGRYDASARAGNDAAALSAKQLARTSADTARSGLATVEANTGTAKANTELGVGSANVGILGGSGNTQAALAARTGDTTGQAFASSGELAGKALSTGVGYANGLYPTTPNQPSVLTPNVGAKSTDDSEGKI